MEFVGVCKLRLLQYFYHHAHQEQLTLAINGAPINIANVTKSWMRDNRLGQSLNWPSNSLDLNPFINLWMSCKGQVQSMNQPQN